MLRVVVAIYLMLVTAVGPAACCCTFARLTERLTPSSTSQAPRPASCCHGGPQSQPPGEKAPPSRERPDSPVCPCKQAGGRELVALPAAPDESLESAARATIESFRFLSIIPPDHTLPPAWALSVFRERPAAGPAVSTDDLLYAFHILRC